MAKVNSLQDTEICRALYRASQAGVQVLLNVRGICCLRPGVAGVSENIEVRSIIDRFLEHARIFYFRNGGHEEVYLASADWMTRNLVKRLEILFPVTDANLRRRLIEILNTFFADNVKARRLLPDGTYRAVEREGPRACGRRRFSIRTRSMRCIWRSRRRWQAQLAGRRGHDRKPCIAPAGRGEGAAEHPRHLLPAAGREGGFGEHHRDLHRGALPGTRRIIYFRNGGHEEVYISSADWMVRNLDKRLEVLCPWWMNLRRRLIGMLETYMADNVKAGGWGGAAGGVAIPPVDPAAVTIS